MLFNSLHFIIFYPVVVLVYFLLGVRFEKYKWAWLVLASYYFYMSWNPWYALLIIFTTIVNYLSAIEIEKNRGNIVKSRFFLLIGIVSSLSVLFVFKYFNFFNVQIANLINFFFNGLFSITESVEPVTLSLLLPVGISFYTFQTLSYTIDVYYNKKAVERHFGIFALYVSFFPQLVAGPIERSKNLLPQFREKHRFNYSEFKSGVLIILIGFIKKMIIADRLAILVNTIYNNPAEYQGLPLILASIFFAFQIYCDFSGYSDIAIGSARIMGIRLMMNFKRPYFARSFRDFWSRWHISLSTWFRDYLYIPLGGNRVNRSRHVFNLIVTFVVSGLWHGAGLTFLAWGFYHGMLLVIENNTQKIRSRIRNLISIKKDSMLHKVFQVLFTFTLVDIGWIFFRSNSMSDALYIFRNLFPLHLYKFRKHLFTFGLDKAEMALCFFALAGLMITQLIKKDRSLAEILQKKPLVIRWAAYMFLIYSIIIFGVYGALTPKEFIYFQF